MSFYLLSKVWKVLKFVNRMQTVWWHERQNRVYARNSTQAKSIFQFQPIYLLNQCFYHYDLFSLRPLLYTSSAFLPSDKITFRHLMLWFTYRQVDSSSDVVSLEILVLVPDPTCHWLIVLSMAELYGVRWDFCTNGSPGVPIDSEYNSTYGFLSVSCHGFEGVTGLRCVESKRKIVDGSGFSNSMSPYQESCY